MIQEEDYDEAIAYLRSFEAEIYEADISTEAEAALHKVTEDKEVTKAVDEEYSAD